MNLEASLRLVIDMTGGSAPSGMMGAVGRHSHVMSRDRRAENPITGSYGDPDATLLRSTAPS